MLLHLLLHPVLENVKAELFIWVSSQLVPLAPSKTNPLLEESECPGILLTSFPTIDMEDGTELDKQALRIENCD